MSSGTVHRRVIYYGRVQGVGFRVTTAHVARGFAVEGTVRNLPDGTVELVVQGDRAEVARFLTKIATDFAGNIDRTEENDNPQPIDVKGFVVRY